MMHLRIAEIFSAIPSIIEYADALTPPFQKRQFKEAALHLLAAHTVRDVDLIISEFPTASIMTFISFAPAVSGE